MLEFIYLIPASLVLGLIGLAAFMWNLHKEQYIDLDGAAQRILDDEDRPLPKALDDSLCDSKQERQNH